MFLLRQFCANKIQNVMFKATVKLVGPGGFMVYTGICPCAFLCILLCVPFTDFDLEVV